MTVFTEIQHSLIALAFAASPDVSPAPPSLPTGAYILPLTSAPSLLKQCSRASPEPGEEFFLPDEISVREAETGLMLFLADQRNKRLIMPEFPGTYSRQYVGYIRGTHRFIYGNTDGRAKSELRRLAVATNPIIVCDGGDAFGFEYDLETRQISHFRVNSDRSVPIILPDIPDTLPPVRLGR